MQTDGHKWLNELAAFPPNTFEQKFMRNCARLGLGSRLDGSEMALLFEAALYASCCNIAFNGLGGCRGEIKPERERSRRRLENRFMAARGALFACAGWKALFAGQKSDIQEVFLSVAVAECNLA